MEILLPYKVIKSSAQYYKYCDRLEELVENNKKSKPIRDEIELLTLLIENYDEHHNSFEDLDPIKLLLALLDEHKMKAKDLVTLLSISKGYVSDILHYKKGLSKSIIRKLAVHFKLRQEAFNRPYKLKVPGKTRLKNKAVMNTRKKLTAA